MLTRDSDFLALQAPKKTDSVITPGRILTAILLGLPFNNQTGITERRRLEETVAGGEWEKEGEMLWKIQSPIWQARTVGWRVQRFFGKFIESLT